MNPFTVFIIVTRGFIIRNILRTGVLDGLLSKGAHVVIIFPARKSVAFPNYLKEEFNRPNVSIEVVPEYVPFGHSLFAQYTSLLVYSRTSWAYSKVGNTTKMQRAWFWKYIEGAAYIVLGLITPLKYLVRYIETNFFFVQEYKQYFEKYRPDVVFGTSIVSRLDIMFMKEAHRRGIRTVCMPKGWDNVMKTLYRFIPDDMMVQNERMKTALVAVQYIKPEHIHVVGFPQFDWYTRKEVLLERSAFLTSIGADPAKKLIVFGSEGVWAKDDRHIAEILAEFVSQEGTLSAPATLLIRPHFSDIRLGRFDDMKGIPNVIIDEHIHASDFFPDNWDPRTDEIIYFTNLMHHADMVISIASTLALDAACAGTPIISPFFGGLMSEDRKADITPVLYETDHFKWVMETKGSTTVYTKDELKEAVNTYFADRSHKALDRKRLVDAICFGNDGHASERITNIVAGDTI